MMNLSMEHHGQQLGFLRDADRVVFVRNNFVPVLHKLNDVWLDAETSHSTVRQY